MEVLKRGEEKRERERVELSEEKEEGFGSKREHNPLTTAV